MSDVGEFSSPVDSITGLYPISSVCQYFIRVPIGKVSNLAHCA